MSKLHKIILLYIFSNLAIAQQSDTTELLQEVDISALSAMRAKQNNAVWIHSTKPTLLRSSGGTSMADGLNFQPGIRVENNCQNCGFTQVRLNGLDGSYTQILFDDMPITSPLLGVYGLEQMPLNLIERIDVVRGGNNAMYGGNALAGTLNIVPKLPITNDWFVGYEQVLTGMQSPDSRLEGSVSHVSPSRKSGYNLSFSGRWRAPYNHNADQLFDSNGDGEKDRYDDFSEIPLIRSAAINYRGFYKPNEKSNLTYGVLGLREFRRGGNAFDVAPELSDITEQINQYTGGFYAKNNLKIAQNQLLSTYGSVIYTSRNSYYGGQSAVENPGIDNAANFYGDTKDAVFVAGVRYFLFLKRWQIQTGSEWRLNSVNDNMPAYGRIIDQNLASIGAYAIATYHLNTQMQVDLSTRYERISSTGIYTISSLNLSNGDAVWHVLNPRLSLLLNAKNSQQWRLNVSRGYRPPQPFDEDLHVSTLQGGANLVFTPSDLKPEQATSISASYNVDANRKGNIYSFSSEAFYTRIQNPFFVLPAQDFIVRGADTIGIVDFRQNASFDALVYGLHAEIKLMLGKAWEIQAGGTAQDARYSQAIDVFDDVQTTQMLRAPRLYGFGSAWYRWGNWETNVSTTYTGSMVVANERLSELRQTPQFLEVNAFVSHTFYAKTQKVRIKAGIINLFDAYQTDLEVGPMRDAAFVYGPMRPRSLYMGVVLMGR